MKSKKYLTSKRVLAFILAFNHFSLMAKPWLFRMRLFPKRHHSEPAPVVPAVDASLVDDQQLEQLKAEDVWLEEVLQPLLSEVLKRHSTVENFVNEINEWGPVEDFKHSE